MKYGRNCLVVLAGISVLAAQSADDAVATQMRREGVHHVRFLARVALDDELDAVVVYGSPKQWPPGAGAQAWWSRESKIGLFLQRRDRPTLVYKIASAEGLGDGECYARVLRVTSGDVVISCKPEKVGPGMHRKFVYDSRAKALVKLVEYVPFQMEHVKVNAEGVSLAGGNSEQRVEMVRERGGGWKVRRLPSPVAIPGPQKTVRFGARNEFTFQVGGLEVLERNGKKYSLPRSTYEVFASERPDQVKNGYVRGTTKIEEGSGPWQLEGDKLWFGKRFYDGEGMTGVGGFGYFDGMRKAFVHYSPSEVRDRSVSAMLVEEEAVWMGLLTEGEWGPSPGGVAKFDRRTEAVMKLELYEIISRMARAGTDIVMATDFGALVWDGKTLRRYFVDVMTNGRLRIVEGLQ